MNSSATSIQLPDLNQPLARNGDTRPLALIISTLRCGGAERVTINLLRAAAEAGIPLDLLLAKAEGSLLSQVPPQVRIIDFNVPRMRSAIPKIALYLRRERPRGVISHMTHVNIAMLIARRLACTTTPLVVVEHSRFSPLSAARKLHPWEQQLARWLYPWADNVVGVSTGVARDVEHSLGLPPQRVRTIYNPIVDAHLLARAEEPCPHPWLSREPWQSVDDRPVLLSVGQLGRPEKDHVTLLRAVAIVRRTRPVRLVIFGEGAERGQIEALRRDLGLEADVDLPGSTDNPYAAMRQASLFVLSSRSEGLPTVLIEALACGCPTVSTTCPSGPTEILDGGRYGVLVPPENPEALAAGILKNLDRLWNHDVLRHRGAEFSAIASLEQYLAILNYPLSATGRGSMMRETP
ncbi:MAG TPA: glycosyltransferase [Pirellulales bacterium]|jgi:glycosyltransferase involved in cell wall biosynthesis|nr:glycosyltransferase [Pirellulales bacterium]